MQKNREEKEIWLKAQGVTWEFNTQGGFRKALVIFSAEHPPLPIAHKIPKGTSEATMDAGLIDHIYDMQCTELKRLRREAEASVKLSTAAPGTKPAF